MVPGWKWYDSYELLRDLACQESGSLSTLLARKHTTHPVLPRKRKAMPIQQRPTAPQDLARHSQMDVYSLFQRVDGPNRTGGHKKSDLMWRVLLNAISLSMYYI
jgi:hypothetical protein